MKNYELAILIYLLSSIVKMRPAFKINILLDERTKN